MITSKNSNIAKSRGAAAGTGRPQTTTTSPDQPPPKPGQTISVPVKDGDEIEAKGVTCAGSAATASPPPPSSATVTLPRLGQELYVQDSKTRLMTGPQDATNEKSRDGQPNESKRAAVWDADADAAAPSPGAFHVSASGGGDLLPDANATYTFHEQLHDVDLEEGSPYGSNSKNNPHIGVHLVEANLVTDEPSRILVAATPVVPEPLPSTEKPPHRNQDAQPKSSRVSKRSLRIIIVALAVVCAAAIAVGIVWGVKRVDDNAARGASSSSTANGSTWKSEELLQHLPEWSGKKIEEQDATPLCQHKAFRWATDQPTQQRYYNEGGVGRLVQRFALATTSCSMGGPASLWTGSGWGEDAPLDECGWQGVDCSNGTVTDLAWASLGLTGTVPEEVGLLTDLQVLDVSNNTMLSGWVPTQVGKLVNLQSLQLAGNKLSGPIPTQLGHLTYLESLQLGRNELTGTIPSELALLSNSLNGLQLSKNALKGTIPSELGRATPLTILSLAQNQLDGTIPAELASLTRLESLRLSQNKFWGDFPPWLDQLGSIHDVDLHDNALEGTIPDALGGLAALREVNVRGNQLAGMVPSKLCARTHPSSSDPVSSLLLQIDCRKVDCSDCNCGCK
jgi:Leucine rich repeat